jgi:hypothetical protein
MPITSGFEISSKNPLQLIVDFVLKKLFLYFVIVLLNFNFSKISANIQIMIKDTSKQFDFVTSYCKDIFVKKAHDYGTAWRILRPSSLTDQIMIKAMRIRSIETKGVQKVDEGIKPEFIGIVNYSVMALIQLELGCDTENINMSVDDAVRLFEKYIYEAKALMENKNHDYSEAWRDMRISSLTDIILMKLFRVKQIEDNKGITKVSEGIDANYYDMINYSIFALIKIEEEN